MRAPIGLPIGAAICSLMSVDRANQCALVFEGGDVIGGKSALAQYFATVLAIDRRAAAYFAGSRKFDRQSPASLPTQRGMRHLDHHLARDCLRIGQRLQHVAHRPAGHTLLFQRRQPVLRTIGAKRGVNSASSSFKCCHAVGPAWKAWIVGRDRRPECIERCAASSSGWRRRRRSSRRRSRMPDTAH